MHSYGVSLVSRPPAGAAECLKSGPSAHHEEYHRFVTAETTEHPVATYCACRSTSAGHRAVSRVPSLTFWPPGTALLLGIL